MITKALSNYLEFNEPLLCREYSW